MCHEMAGGTPVVIIFSRGGKEMKKSIFQELVEESIVLLKNEEQILPLKEKKVAFLGRAQIETKNFSTCTCSIHVRFSCSLR